MWRKLLALYFRMKYRMSYDYCYHEMELKYYAIGKRCSGLAGGDKFTNYLSYSCVDCPYLYLNYRKQVTEQALAEMEKEK